MQPPQRGGERHRHGSGHPGQLGLPGGLARPPQTRGRPPAGRKQVKDERRHLDEARPGSGQHCKREPGPAAFGHRPLKRHPKPHTEHQRHGLDQEGPRIENVEWTRQHHGQHQPAVRWRHPPAAQQEKYRRQGQVKARDAHRAPGLGQAPMSELADADHGPLVKRKLHRDRPRLAQYRRRVGGRKIVLRLDPEGRQCGLRLAEFAPGQILALPAHVYAPKIEQETEQKHPQSQPAFHARRRLNGDERFHRLRQIQAPPLANPIIARDPSGRNRLYSPAPGHA